MDVELILSIVYYDTYGSSILHDDLRSGSLKQNLNVLALIAVGRQNRNQVRTYGQGLALLIHGLVDTLYAGAAKLAYLAQIQRPGSHAAIQ